MVQEQLLLRLDLRMPKSECYLAHEVAKAWPDETIGIVKVAVGGTSLLAWKPNWTKRDADRVGQGKLGPRFNLLMDKVELASKARDIEIVGFLWLQGGGDMKKVDVAKEYLDNLKSLVAKVKQLLRKRRAEGVDVSKAVELDEQSRIVFQSGDKNKCRKLLRQAIDLLQRQPEK